MQKPSTAVLTTLWILVWTANNYALYGPSNNPAAIGLIITIPIGAVITITLVLSLHSALKRSKSPSKRVLLVIAMILIVCFGILPIATIQAMANNILQFGFELPG